MKTFAPTRPAWLRLGAAATQAASDAAAQAAREQETARLEAELATLDGEVDGWFKNLRSVLGQWRHTEKARRAFQAAYLLMQDDNDEYQDLQIYYELGREPDPASRKADAAALSKQAAARPGRSGYPDAIIQASAWISVTRKATLARDAAATEVASSTAAAGSGGAGRIVSK